MMNNPIGVLLNAARSGGNTSQLISQMAQSDPRAAQVNKIIQGKSPAQLQQIAMNMCKERGTSPEAIIQALMSQGGVM